MNHKNYIFKKERIYQMNILTKQKEKTWKMGELEAAGRDELFLRTEDGDNQIVVSVILIVIAVGLCLIFKEQIGTIITNNITAIGTKIGDILSGF